MEQTLAKVTRIQAGRYAVDDGRCIIKNNSGWLIVDANGAHDFGPVPTLAAAKEYVESGTVPLRQHNFSTSHGRRQSKKEFNAYLASEAKKWQSNASHSLDNCPLHHLRHCSCSSRLLILDRKCCMSSQPENYTSDHDHHRKNA